MKRYGEVREDSGGFRIITDPVYVSRKLLVELCDRLESRLPSETISDILSAGQIEINASIKKDRLMIDQIREKLKL